MHTKIAIKILKGRSTERKSGIAVSQIIILFADYNLIGKKAANAGEPLGVTTYYIKYINST
jgi:hypothetical protein